jgi:hypothetical protein
VHWSIDKYALSDTLRYSKSIEAIPDPSPLEAYVKKVEQKNLGVCLTAMPAIEKMVRVTGYEITCHDSCYTRM